MLLLEPNVNFLPFNYLSLFVSAQLLAPEALSCNAAFVRAVYNWKNKKKNPAHLYELFPLTFKTYLLKNFSYLNERAFLIKVA